MLTKLGFGKVPPLVGIDISSTTVKLLELSRKGVDYRVESYAVAPLPPEAVIEKTVNHAELVAEVIRDLVGRSGTKARRAVAAVSGSAVITKTIAMPAGLSEEDIEAQLTLEADQYIPYPLDEVAMDFEALGPISGQDNCIHVLLAACREETIESRVGALVIAGLTPIIMDIEVFARERAMTLLTNQLPAGQHHAIGMVDIGASMTTLSVFAGDESIYTREHLFGGMQLTEDIMNRYGLSFEEAGCAKKQGGLPDGGVPNDFEEAVLAPFLDAVESQISRSLQFFFSSSEYAELDYIVLCGGVAVMEGLAERISKRVSTPTIIANPFASMSVASRVNAQALARDAPAMMVACGLAMRRLNDG